MEAVGTSLKKNRFLLEGVGGDIKGAKFTKKMDKQVVVLKL